MLLVILGLAMKANKKLYKNHGKAISTIIIGIGLTGFLVSIISPGLQQIRMANSVCYLHVIPSSDQPSAKLHIIVSQSGYYPLSEVKASVYDMKNLKPEDIPTGSAFIEYSSDKAIRKYDIGNMGVNFTTDILDTVEFASREPRFYDIRFKGSGREWHEALVLTFAENRWAQTIIVRICSDKGFKIVCKYSDYPPLYKYLKEMR
ncbi:MAG: hypothetical protein NTX71_01940 [Candidatus Aureabacteria bacterium]|nr:hypothetical protein [Candidatus Auribacterota bacterium]